MPRKKAAGKAKTKPMDEDDELRAAADALAEGERTMRMPRRVVEALCPPHSSALGLPLGPLTMEGWLRLIEAESAYVAGEKPRDRGAEVRQFVFATAVLSGRSMAEVESLLGASSPEDILASMHEVEARIDEAFPTLGLKMEKPLRKDEKPAPTRPSRDGGLGRWTLLFVAMLQDLGMSRAEARTVPVAEAGVLLAASKFREGYDVVGTNWRQAEILGESSSAASAVEESGGDGNE